MIPLFKVFIAPDAGEHLNETLYSGFIGEGPKVKLFEKTLAEWLKTDQVLALNSATSGLELAAYLLRCKSQGFSRVHTTALSCTATNWPLIHMDLDLDWVDVDSTTLNMDLDDLRSRINWASAGIVLTHWGGRAHDMDAIRQIQVDFLKEYGRPLIVVEDCAHAFQGYHRGQPLGTFGDFGIYSFQAVKPLTTGDGGCIISRDKEDYALLKKLRWYGIDRDDRDAEIMWAGFKYHMNDLAATLGMANILPAYDNVQRARANARFYDEALAEVLGVTLLAKSPDYILHPYFLYTILVDRRDDFIKAMRERGVEAALAHTRNDQYACTRTFQYRTLPNLDSVCERYINIPVGWWVSGEDREHVVDSIKKGW